MTMSSRPKATRILPFTVLAVLAAVLVASTARAQTAPWTVVPSPNATSGFNQFNAVGTITASDVWAVGSAELSSGSNEPLAEHWDGTAWSIVPTPGVAGSLNGVAGVSSADVWAAGSIILSSRGNEASFIHWNGRKWTVAKSGVVANAGMTGITAVSSADVWAVGDVQEQTTPFAEQTLIEHWNGKTWSVVASPDATVGNNILNAVTAVSASDIWAVGQFTDASDVIHTLTEHWDGTAWSIVASPDGPGFESRLEGATAVSASDVWAVGGSGGSGTLTEQWNGTSWSVVASPTVTTSDELNGIAAVTASDIWATGNTFNTSTSEFQAFIEQWNGTSWTMVPTPNPGTAAFLRAAAVDPASGQAWAVGDSTPAQFTPTQTLTEFNP